MNPNTIMHVKLNLITKYLACGCGYEFGSININKLSIPKYCPKCSEKLWVLE